MLADTAVAVHPDPTAAFEKVRAELEVKLAAASDKGSAIDSAKSLMNWPSEKKNVARLIQLRDMAFAGRKLMLPLMNREIPLIADVWAKPELGSGCVKITPAHDPNDYEVGHALGCR